jgi:hypothetical protein
MPFYFVYCQLLIKLEINKNKTRYIIANGYYLITGENWSNFSCRYTKVELNDKK